MRTLFLLSLCSLLALSRVNANDIQITNAALTGNNNSAGTRFVQFDVTWQNSWRQNGVVNWDAAWIFVKFRTAGGLWQHALLGNTGHVAPTGSQIVPGLLTPGQVFNAVTNPVIGTFIHRSTDGTGTFSVTGAQLRWNYAQQGLGFNDITEVRVLGIEMVYVDQGAFAVGTGGTESAAFTLTTINTANATTTPGGTGALGGQAGGFPTGQTAPNSASWPNGFDDHYGMKYEVTQQGYVDFLNTLTFTQQTTRTANAPSNSAGTGAMATGNSFRNGIDIQTPGVAPSLPAVLACNLDGDALFGEATDGQDIAANFLSWGDLCAYLDWCGLRPMSELEFEKACRGPLLPVANEFPWGTVNMASAGPYTLTNAGTPAEGIATNYATTAGNGAYAVTTPVGGAINGPLRVGTFAANPFNTGRVTAGATYYGQMNMGDNLLERTVALDQVDGKAYTGEHGNGSLAPNGDPNVNSWPSPTTALGSYQRGGYWQASLGDCRTSRRFSGADATRNTINGGRGVRTAP